MKSATFAEFFAGIGLVRDAIGPLGWVCTFANDISEKKAEMYRARFGDGDLAVKDVAELRTSDLPAGLSLVTASFPCIDVSLAGNRAGLAGKHTGAYWPFFHLLQRYSEENDAPTAILLENVTGLVSSHGGADLEKIIQSLNELGYRCDLVKVDAKWFVPQSRPRLFVVALQRDDQNMATDWDSRTTRLRPEPIQRFVSAHPELELGHVILPDPPERIGDRTEFARIPSCG
ncbi:MAG: DNA (cytosine-5-)-methyltransferase [Planctomycetes bacterium]|nr:DNA (cytosine-5-)-methyltransferase [Planctomycetota bacterium]